MNFKMHIHTVKDSYSMISGFLTKYWFRIGLEIIFLGGFIALSVISAFLNKYVIDTVILNRDINAFYTFVFIVLGLLFFSLLWKFLASYIQALTRQKLSADVRSALFLHLQEVPINILHQFLKPGELAYRYFNDVSTIEDMIISFITKNIVSIVHLIVVVFLLIRFNAILAMISLGSIIAYLLVYWIFRNKIMMISKIDYTAKTRT